MVKVKKQNILFALFASLLLIVLYAVFVSSYVQTTIHPPYTNDIIYNLTVQSLQFNCSGNMTTDFAADLNVSNVSLYGNWSGSYIEENSTANLNGTSYNGTIVSFNETNIPEGGPYVWSCAFFVNSSTADNNVTNSTQNRTFTIDTTVPSFNSTASSNSAPSTGQSINITIKANGGTSGIKNASLLLNGTFNKSVRIQQDVPYNFSVNISSVELGKVYNFSFRVSDYAGNTNTSLGSLVIVASDGTVPEIALSNPVNLFNNSNGTVFLHFTPTDNNASDVMTCAINVSQNGVSLEGVASNGVSNGSIVGIDITSGSLYTNSTALNNGTYKWNVTCLDGADNENTSLTRTFTVDTAVPLFRNVSLLSTTASPSFEMSMTAVWNGTYTTIQKVYLLVNISGNTNRVVNSTAVLTDNNRVNLSFVINSSLSSQVLSFRMLGNDSAGNTNTTPLNSSFIVTVDDVAAPTITHIYPVNRSNISTSSPSLNFSASDVSNLVCDVNLNEVLNVTGIDLNASSGTYRNTTAFAGLADGRYNYSINCSDTSGNIGISGNVSFTVDTAVPSFNATNNAVSNSAPATGATINITVRATDGVSGVKNASLLVNGILNKSVRIQQGVAYNFSVNISSADLGKVYNFSFRVSDYAGNTNTSLGSLVTIASDATAPEITLNNPINLFNNSNGTVFLHFTPTDNNASEVMTCAINISLNGISLNGVVSNGTINGSITGIDITSGSLYTNSTALNNGTYKWNVTCLDSADNENTSLTRTFTVDNAVPSFKNLSISDTTASPAQVIVLTVVWNGTYTSMKNVSLLVNISGQTNRIVNSSNGTVPQKINLSFAVNSSLSSQVLSFRMLGYDHAGNSNSTPLTSAFIVTVADVTAPTITIVYPTNRSNITAGSPSINFTVSDVSSVDCEIYLNDTVNVTGIDLNASSGTYRNTTAFAGLLDQKYNYSINCTDTSGNTARTGNITFTIDRGSPSIALTAPANNSNVSLAGTITITVADDTTAVKTRTYATSCGTSGSFTSGTAFTPFNDSGTTCSSKNNTRTINITAIDHVGNQNVTGFVFGVDDVAPLIGFVRPTAGARLTQTTGETLINITVNDSFSKLSFVGYYLDSSSSVAQMYFSTQGLNFTSGRRLNANFIVLNLDAGNHSIKFTANDTLGNKVNSSTITFRVNASIALSKLNNSIASVNTKVGDTYFRIKSGGAYSTSTGTRSDGNTYEVAFELNGTNSILNVTLTDFNGSSANWAKFNVSAYVSSNVSDVLSGVKANWTTKIQHMVWFNNSLSEFIGSANDYYGMVTFPTNATEFWYFEDEADFSTRTAVSACGSTIFTKATTNPCFNYTSGGRVIVFVPHYSVVAAVNDTIVPSITINTPAAAQAISHFVPNITASLDAASCVYILNITNSAKVTPASSSNTSNATPSNGKCTWDRLGFKNGYYNITYNVTDAAGNTNQSSRVFTMLDATMPDTGAVTETGTATGGTVTLTNINESANVTVFYGASPTSLTGVAMQTDFSQTQVVTINSGEVSDETIIHYNVSVCDFNGNCFVNGTYNLTQFATSSDVPAASSGSSGGGAAVAKTTSVAESKTQVWGSVPAGSSVSMKVNSENIAITALNINEVNRELANMELKVSSLSANPVSASPGTTYQYLSVDKKVLKDTDGTFTIAFRVPSSWITQAGLKSADLSLYRYSNGWAKLSTKVTGSDSKYVNYEATTPGFSYFAVAAASAAETPAEEPETPSEEPAAQPGEEPGVAPEAPITGEKKKSNLLMFAIIAVIVIAIAGFILSRMQKGKKDSDDIEEIVDEVRKKRK